MSIRLVTVFTFLTLFLSPSLFAQATTDEDAVGFGIDLGDLGLDVSGAADIGGTGDAASGATDTGSTGDAASGATDSGSTGDKTAGTPSGDPADREDEAQGGEADSTTTGSGSTADDPTKKEDPALGGESGGSSTDRGDSPVGSGSGTGNDPLLDLGTLLGGSGTKGKGSTSTGTDILGGGIAPKGTGSTTSTTTSTPATSSGVTNTKEIIREKVKVVKVPGATPPRREKKDSQNWLAPAIAAFGGLAAGLIAGSGSKKKSSSSSKCNPNLLYNRSANGFVPNANGAYYCGQDGLFYPYRTSASKKKR